MTVLPGIAADRQTALGRLRDRRRIEELLARRAVASDRRDPPSILACHTEDATDDHGSGRERVRDFIGRLSTSTYRDPDTGPQKHAVSNVLIDYADQDTVLVETAHLAYHRFGVVTGPTDHLIAGRYLDRLRRTGDGWLIADRTVVYQWSRSVGATRHVSTGRPSRIPPVLTTTTRGSPGMASERDTVGELLAKQAITEVLYLRARAGDRRDHDLALSCYHEGATEEHEGFTGPAADFVLQHSAFAPGKTPPAKSMQHLVTNVLIDLVGDVASVESYHLYLATGRGTDSEEDTMIGGRYLDRFAQRDGRWAITHRQVVFDWSRVEPAAARFWDRYPDPSLIAFGRMGPDDPLYAHRRSVREARDG